MECTKLDLKPEELILNKVVIILKELPYEEKDIDVEKILNQYITNRNRPSF